MTPVTQWLRRHAALGTVRDVDAHLAAGEGGNQPGDGSMTVKMKGVKRMLGTYRARTAAPLRPVFEPPPPVPAKYRDGERPPVAIIDKTKVIPVTYG